MSIDVIHCLSVSLRPKKCEGAEFFSYPISVYIYMILSAELRDMNLYWNLDSRFIFIYEIYACVYTYKRALFNISDLLSRIQKCWLCVARLYGYEDVNKKRVSYNLSCVCKWYRPCRMDGEALMRTANYYLLSLTLCVIDSGCDEWDDLYSFSTILLPLVLLPNGRDELGIFSERFCS